MRIVPFLATVAARITSAPLRFTPTRRREGNMFVWDVALNVGEVIKTARMQMTVLAQKYFVSVSVKCLGTSGCGGIHLRLSAELGHHQK